MPAAYGIIFYCSIARALHAKTVKAVVRLARIRLDESD